MANVNSTTVRKQALAGLKWILWSASADATRIRDSIFDCGTARPEKITFSGINANFRAEFEIINVDSGRNIYELNEEALIKYLYCDPSLYNKVGKHFCIMLDIAVAKGSSEAIVESAYSVMKKQAKDGGQDNETLVNRTIVSWHCPASPLGIPDLVEEATLVHHKKAYSPISKLNFGMSTVMSRLNKDRGRIPS